MQSALLEQSALDGLLRPSDIALLQASLWDGDEAKAAFRRWRSMTDFEGNHDMGQFRMLPLLHANMSRLNMVDPVMPRLRGVHRYSWCEARRRELMAVRAISALQAEGIACMALKGLALSQDYYQDAALRPMQDIDLLIRIEDVTETLNCLAALGWKYPTTAIDGSIWRRKMFFATEKSINLSHPDGGEIDLHWYPFHEGMSQRVSDRFWKNAVEMQIGDLKLLRPCASDLLLHVVMHGLRTNVVAPLRWAADAAMVIQRDSETIDWDELNQFAASIKVRSRFYFGLSLLNEALIANISIKTDGAPPTVIERFEHHAHASLSYGPVSPRNLWLQRGLYYGRIWYGDKRYWVFPLLLQYMLRRSQHLFKWSTRRLTRLVNRSNM